MGVSREEDLQWFATFVAESRWRFAKTYVQSYLHEYTLDEWCEDANFDRAIQCIERWGVEEAFWGARRKYLYVDERKYWHMGDASSADVDEQPGLINRSWTDVAAYREEARKLGYDEKEMDLLVGRWRTLLARAMRSDSE
jgi:hypothetical protein